MNYIPDTRIIHINNQIVFVPKPIHPIDYLFNSPYNTEYIINDDTIIESYTSSLNKQELYLQDQSKYKDNIEMNNSTKLQVSVPKIKLNSINDDDSSSSSSMFNYEF